jgi:hypothetical protein
MRSTPFEVALWAIVSILLTFRVDFYSLFEVLAPFPGEGAVLNLLVA